VLTVGHLAPRRPGIPCRTLRLQPARDTASAVAALGLTTLTTAQASPERLNWLVHDRWGIEANHWLPGLGRRPLPAPPRLGPPDHAGLRNLATGLIRASGRTQIAPTLRWVSRNPVRALIVLSQTA
jgi:hypothetical protein